MRRRWIPILRIRIHLTCSRKERGRKKLGIWHEATFCALSAYILSYGNLKIGRTHSILTSSFLYLDIFSIFGILSNFGCGMTHCTMQWGWLYFQRRQLSFCGMVRYLELSNLYVCQWKSEVINLIFWRYDLQLFC